ncbi:MAG: hypothetical protein ACI9GM_000660 [Salibacteraceae bacterium]|jgi:hypothetical protein
MSYSIEKGWELSDLTGTNVYANFKNENAHIRIVDNQLVIYTMSEGVWSKHPESKFLDLLKIKHKTIQIENNNARFDAFSSFWVSAVGGHIRVSKYAETEKHTLESGEIQTRINQNLANQIFLNRNPKAKITSRNTIFMISPKGNIFEIDHTKKIWRFILTNRTLTPWTSDPPTDKVVFHIFKKTDFKSVIPIGTKNNKFLFQVINHQNKMGLATLSKDYFQISYIIPPLFDFISPSLANDFHLIFNENQLGILTFIPQENKNKIPDFNTFFIEGSQQLMSKGSSSNPLPILADNSDFKITKNDVVFSNTDFVCSSHFGIEMVSSDLILYNEYSENGSIRHSGLFKTSQSSWYIKPNANYLKLYKRGILETKFSSKNTPVSHSIYSLAGRSLSTAITDINSKEFFYLSAVLSGTPIDSMAQISSFGPFYYKYKSMEKWGLIHFEKANWEILSPATYLRIDQLGYKKSLILTSSSAFDWYGLNYQNTKNQTPEWIRNQNPLLLFANNAMYSSNEQDHFIASAVFLENLYIYSSPETSEVYKAGIKTPQLTGIKTEAFNYFISLSSWQNNTVTHSLFKPNLKLVKTHMFDSLFLNNETLFLLKKSQSLALLTPNGATINIFEVSDAFYQGRPIKSLKKYDKIYLTKNYLIGKKEDSWTIIDPSGIHIFAPPYNNLLDAFRKVQSLK